jgi:hypothetical protein
LLGKKNFIKFSFAPDNIKTGMAMQGLAVPWNKTGNPETDRKQSNFFTILGVVHFFYLAWQPDLLTNLMSGILIPGRPWRIIIKIKIKYYYYYYKYPETIRRSPSLYSVLSEHAPITWHRKCNC